MTLTMPSLKRRVMAKSPSRAPRRSCHRAPLRAMPHGGRFAAHLRQAGQPLPDACRAEDRKRRGRHPDGPLLLPTRGFQFPSQPDVRFQKALLLRAPVFVWTMQRLRHLCLLFRACWGALCRAMFGLGSECLLVVPWHRIGSVVVAGTHKAGARHCTLLVWLLPLSRLSSYRYGGCLCA